MPRYALVDGVDRATATAHDGRSITLTGNEAIDVDAKDGALVAVLEKNPAFQLESIEPIARKSLAQTPAGIASVGIR